jgi:hypothetical protein
MKTGHLGLTPKNERYMPTDAVHTILPQTLASGITRIFKIRYRITMVKPYAATAVVELLMMGVRMPKTC